MFLNDHYHNAIRRANRFVKNQLPNVILKGASHKRPKSPSIPRHIAEKIELSMKIKKGEVT